jgi:GR25 family glycosyltransferase involved in LPS biosynthesis
MIFYWINLDKDIQRRQNIEKLFLENNCPNVRIPAILGEPTEKDKEIACTHSHVKAIRAFLESSDESAIICEDDLSFEHKKYWKTDVAGVVKNAPADWEIIQIAITVHGDTINKFYTSNDYLPHSPGHHSTLCYVINRMGAEKIVNVPVIGVADKFLYKCAKTYTYRYPMFVQADNVGSNIHPQNIEGHTKSKLMVRELLEWSMLSK